MNKIAPSILLLLLSVLTPFAGGQKPNTKSVAGEDCKCTITPFTPEVPCFNYCTTNLLARASLEELLIAFRLKEDSARKIFAWEGKTQATSLEDYVKAEKLTTYEAEAVKKRIDVLNKAQLEYFSRPERIRVLILNSERKAIFNRVG
jgi:hypothetical protein